MVDTSYDIEVTVTGTPEIEKLAEALKRANDSAKELDGREIGIKFDSSPLQKQVDSLRSSITSLSEIKVAPILDTSKLDLKDSDIKINIEGLDLLKEYYEVATKTMGNVALLKEMSKDISLKAVIKEGAKKTKDENIENQKEQTQALKEVALEHEKLMGSFRDVGGVTEFSLPDINDLELGFVKTTDGASSALEKLRGMSDETRQKLVDNIDLMRIASSKLKTEMKLLKLQASKNEEQTEEDNTKLNYKLSLYKDITGYYDETIKMMRDQLSANKQLTQSDRIRIGLMTTMARQYRWFQSLILVTLNFLRVISGVSPVLGSIMSLIGAGLGYVLNMILIPLLPLAVIILEKLIEIGDWIREMNEKYKIIGDFGLGSLIGLVLLAIPSLWAMIKVGGGVLGMVRSVGGVFRWLGNAIIKSIGVAGKFVVNTVIPAISSGWSKLTAFMGKSWAALANYIGVSSSVLSGIVAGALIGLLAVWVLYKTGVLDIIKEIGAWVGKSASMWGQAFGYTFSALSKFMMAALHDAFIFGKSFINNILDGIQSVLDSVGLGSLIDLGSAKLDLTYDTAMRDAYLLAGRQDLGFAESVKAGLPELSLEQIISDNWVNLLENPSVLIPGFSGVEQPTFDELDAAPTIEYSRDTYNDSINVSEINLIINGNVDDVERLRRELPDMITEGLKNYTRPGLISGGGI